MSGRKNHSASVQRRLLNRARFRQRFEIASQRLRGADADVRLVVGLRVSVLFMEFTRHYRRPKAFARATRTAKLRYIRRLAAQERQARREAPELVLAFRLFRIWLCAVAGDERSLVAGFTDEINVYVRDAKRMALERASPVGFSLTR